MSVFFRATLEALKAMEGTLYVQADIYKLIKNNGQIRTEKG